MDAVTQKFICKPRLKWKCPPEIALNPEWEVAAGEESEEVKTQSDREKRVREAVYPSRAYIPPSPYPPLDVQEVRLDESQIPLVPLTGIEDDQPGEEEDSSSPGGLSAPLPSTSAVSQNDASGHLKSSTIDTPAPEVGSSTPVDVALAAMTSAVSQNDASGHLKPSTIDTPAPHAGSSTPDVALAAMTVASALMKSQELGNSVDTNLLVQILRDPTAVQELISKVGASGSLNIEPVLETKVSKRNMPLASSKSGRLEEGGNKLGVLEKSLGISSIKPYTVFMNKNNQNAEVAHKEYAHLSTSDQMNWGLGAYDKRAVPAHETESMSSWSTFISQPDMGVHKYSSSSTALIAGPLASPSNSEPTLKEFKWPNTEYGEPTKTGFKPIRGPPASLPHSENDLDEFKWINNGYAAPSRTEPYPRLNLSAPTFLKAVLSDAVRSTDSRVMVPSLDAARVSPNLFLNQVQPGPETMKPLLNMGRPGLEMTAPVPNQFGFGSQITGRAQVAPAPLLLPSAPKKAIPGLGTNAPVPNQLGYGSEMTGHSPNAGPQLRDANYLKSLVQQHGKMLETQDFSLSFHQGGPKLVGPYFNPDAQAAKIQRPCFFFSRPEGCRQGETCPYLHVQPQNMQLGSVTGVHSSKRMKMDGGIFAKSR